jgi:hypothetical protein
MDEKGFVATIRPRTYRVWYIVRAFMGPGGDPGPAFETHRQTKITNEDHYTSTVAFRDLPIDAW